MQIWSIWKKKPKNLESGTSNLEISKNMGQMRLERQIIFVNIFFTLLDVIYSDYF